MTSLGEIDNGIDGKKRKIPWEMGSIILAFLGLIYFFYSRSPQITVKNELALPIKIYANTSKEFLGRVGANDSRTFKFYSGAIFPIKIFWESDKQSLSNGKPVGDSAQGSLLVDNHRTVKITNIAGRDYYFMPLINNNTDMTCKISINDELLSEQSGGVLLPGRQGVKLGYYKWTLNSNVTLYCGDVIRYWGERSNKEGPPLPVESPSGETLLTLTP